MRREQHSADQMQLWIRFMHTDGVAGIATLDGYHSVVASHGYQTAIHELGHNFGCQHDRDESSSGASDDDGKYNYAWSDKGEAKYNEDDPDEKPKPYYYGTIMSYARTDRFDYFSNPYVYHSYYDVLGRLKTSPMGYYLTKGGFLDSRAAFNALQLSRRALWMSIIGDPPTKPKILEQPQSVMLSVGATATLRVYASSPPRAGDVRYKWRTATQVVQDGASDSLTVAGATAGRIDVYYVEISNSAGSVTSNPATVTVSVVDVPTTYSDSSGGGGSLSLWYLPCLVLLVAARTFARRK
jgi:hypothetical protein